MESQRATGRLAGRESAQGLRLRLERSLNKLNDDYLQMMKQGLDFLGYPHHDIAMVSGERAFYSLLERVEPLPANLAAGLSGDPFGYSMDQLEALHTRGRDVRDGITRMRREIGNEFFKRAASMPDKQNALDLARKEWMFTIMQGGLESVASLCNIAALALQRKK